MTHISYKLLQNVASRVILIARRNYGEGDLYDRHGRVHHARGGCTESASTCRYHQALAAYWGIARVQDRWAMAHQTVRVRRVSTEAQEHEDTVTRSLKTSKARASFLPTLLWLCKRCKPAKDCHPGSSMSIVPCHVAMVKGIEGGK